MIGQSNVTHLLVGKDLDILANTSKRDDLAVGRIGIFLVGSQTANGAAVLAAGSRFTIATKNSKGVIVETPVIEYDNISGKNAVDYVAPSQRVRAIGFDGISGSIDVTNNANYVAHIFWYDNSKTFGYGKPTKFAAYYSSASADQAEIAAGLVQNFNKNFSREVPKILTAEMVINDAGAVITGTGDLGVTKGSKYVTAATDADAVISVGDFLRIGTAVDDPCYKVVAIDTVNNILTLDTPYQKNTNTILEANAEVIVAANAATAACGVVITAQALTEDFEAGIIRYDVTEFEIELGDEFGATSQSVLSNPSDGSGTYWEVAENEWFLKGNRGEAWRVGNYPKNVVLEATEGINYDQISINYATYGAQTIDRKVASFGTTMIAIDNTGANNAYVSLKTALGI